VSEPTVRLIDAAAGPGRTTATLIASLTARLSMLHLVTGAGAVGSMVAGFAALGRKVTETAEGQRMRRALESTRAASNGDALWRSLFIDRWASGSPAAPVLDQLRNDLALLLAGDVEETLKLLPLPGAPVGGVPADDAEASFLDCLLGLWAFSRQFTAAVEALAAMSRPVSSVLPAARPREEPAGPLLR
jgi:hypothetical protein